MSGALDADLHVARGDFLLDLHLDIPDGGVLALMGVNGAGKSTAVAAIAGLLPVPAGRIVLDGVVLDGAGPEEDRARPVPPERRPIGTVQQQPALFPHLTVLDNVAFGLRTAGRSRRVARAAADALLEQAGLAGFRARRPAELSGGQAARVALLRTLAREPALVLLDEPLAAIDADARPGVRDAIRDRLRAFAGSALLVTHDVRDAAALADEVLVVEGGRAVQRGPLAELRAAPATASVARLLEPQTSSTPSG